MTRKDDLRDRIEAAVRKSGLLGDGYADLITLQPEILDRMEALADRLERAGGAIDPRLLRQVARATMSSEERKRWIVGCSVLLAVGILLAGVAGWSYRDSCLRQRCMEVYGKAEVCLALMR